MVSDIVLDEGIIFSVFSQYTKPDFTNSNSALGLAKLVLGPRLSQAMLTDGFVHTNSLMQLLPDVGCCYSLLWVVHVLLLHLAP